MSLREEILILSKKERYTFDDLVAITRILRSEEGCPWDREQDHHSTRVCLIEETYEVVEAIDNDDAVLLREELGDLLFQTLFHAQIEAERQTFDMSDVVDDIAKKMVHRHPHVFGNVAVANSGEVLKNWENIKTEEKQRNSLVEKLRAIPPMMPALMRASKVAKKAGRSVGATKDELVDSLVEKLDAFRDSSTEFDPKKQIGAILMAVTDLARAYEVDAEHALMQETERLIDEVAKKAE